MKRKQHTDAEKTTVRYQEHGGDTNPCKITYSPKRHAALMSLPDEEAEKRQYAIMEYNSEMDSCKVTYSPKRPVRTEAQRSKGRNIEILGPQTMDELQTTIEIVLSGMRYPQPSGSEDEESEEEGDDESDTQ